MPSWAQIQQMIAPTTIGARLRGVIEFRRERLSGFAAAVSIPYRTLQNHLRDERKPGPDHLGRLAGAGLDVVWLVTGRYRGALSRGEWVDAPTTYALGATDFVDRLLQRIEEFGDAFQDRHYDGGGDPLRGYEREAALDVYRDMCLRTLIEKAESIQKRAARGESPDELLEFITAPLTPELDERLRRAVAGAASRVTLRRLTRPQASETAEPKIVARESSPHLGVDATISHSGRVPPTGDWLPPRPERADLARRISEYAEKRGISFRDALVEVDVIHGIDPPAPSASGQANVGSPDTLPRKD